MHGSLHQSALILIGSWVMALLAAAEPSPAQSASSAAQAPSSNRPNPAAHWAYQPVRRPALPPVRAADRNGSPIDAFILAKLEAHGLALSPPADRRTLIRRASLDLVGLPPTWEETESFVADESPDAFAKVVDRLLASPRYGERWGRHWLDVARFAETKDLVLLFGKDRLQPYAYTYRDYVVRAFNEDTPFDQLIREQIAADQIESKVARWRLAALGFLTVGRLFDNNPHDQIDDQIDTVTRGFLGLTVACARCHNHKYDAIPTEDYYSLYGVFASSTRPYDLPLLEDPARVPGGLEFEKQLAQARQKLQEHIDAQYQLLSEAARQRVSDYLERVATTKPDISETATFFLSLSPDDLRPGLVLRCRRYVEQRAQPEDPVFGLWAELMALPEEQFSDKAKEVTAKRAAGSIRTNPLLLQAFKDAVVTNKASVARVYGQLLHRLDEESKQASPDSPPNSAKDELLRVVVGKESPLYFSKESTSQFMSRTEKDKFGTLVRELDRLAAYATNAPPARAMVVTDAPELFNPHVLVRGSPARLGKEVPRRFLRVLAGEKREPFPHGSGRLDLANAIADPENPLTSRVIVNRVWMHHFGEPLVNSPSDFGTRSEPPTHPELLDWLAWRFTHEQGWSLKQLHREIMLSQTYQQSSRDRADGRKADPDNRLLWRANRRRLEFESMRDSLLTVSGRLDPAMGGRSVDVAGDPLNRRRTVYGLVDRQDLPAVFRAFDFACPDQSVERRPRTIVPQQALFAMNSPFVIEQARALARRVQAGDDMSQVSPLAWAGPAPSGSAAQPERCPGPARAVTRLYQLTFLRAPTDQELALATEFLEQAAADRGSSAAGGLSGLEQFAQVLLMSNELMFVD